jgi:hypothetical protein
MLYGVAMFETPPQQKGCLITLIALDHALIRWGFVLGLGEDDAPGIDVPISYV